MLDLITPLIVTYNEQPNIERNLRQLSWAHDIVLVDSFSTDGTVEIARQFPQVRVFQRAFDTHRQQWSFGLNETEIKTPWILALDADYIATDQFVKEIQSLAPQAAAGGYMASFSYCVDGKSLRCGIYPPVIVLYRREGAQYEQDGHTQKLNIKGEVRLLNTSLLHDDRKPVTRWLNSQAQYAELEARKLRTSKTTQLSFSDRLRGWYVVAPPAMLCYCLFVRGGIFDGWAGLQYALERTVAELMLSLHLIRNRVRYAAATDAVQATTERAPELKPLGPKL